VNVTLARLRDHGYLTWQSVLAWLLLALALAQMLLFFRITTPNTPATLPILLLYPLTLCGALIILLATAWLHHGKRRRSTLLMAGALLCSTIVGVFQAIARVRGLAITTPATEALFMLAYLCGFAAAALYFPGHVAWVGNALRVVLDSVTVGCAAFIFTYSWLPQLHNPAGWALHLNSYLALDIGLLFALIIVVIRYGPGGGPIVVLMCFAIGCLFLGDLVFTFFTLLPGGTRWRFITGPFYSLHSGLTALGYYRSVQSPPEFRTQRTMRQPGLEWFCGRAFPASLC
jgi:hypothetical protein